MLSKKTITFMSLILAIMSWSLEAQAQRGGGGWDTTQNEPADTGVVLARWRFGHNGWFGGYGWVHNYPSTDQNLGQFVDEATNIEYSKCLIAGLSWAAKRYLIIPLQ